MPALSPSACSQRLAEGDADVFDRVMLIDVQIALGLDRQIERRVLGQQREHVVEEADAGGDRGSGPSRRGSVPGGSRFRRSCDGWWRCVA